MSACSIQKPKMTIFVYNNTNSVFVSKEETLVLNVRFNDTFSSFGEMKLHVFKSKDDDRFVVSSSVLGSTRHSNLKIALILCLNNLYPNIISLENGLNDVHIDMTYLDEKYADSNLVLSIKSVISEINQN